MNPPIVEAAESVALPNHLQLPETDGAIVENFQENPQANLVTDSLTPRLRELHPDGQFAIGCDSGIYYRHTQPPLKGCKSPDWFYIPGVPPMLDGTYRRSYVLWQEMVRPLVIAEFVSGDGSEERDTTPRDGKFWVYEQALAVPYYVIFDSRQALLEVYHLEDGKYRLLAPNGAGRYAVAPLGVELGIWEGEYRGMNLPWLRVWDAATGELMPTFEERAAQERQRAEEERQRAEEAESLLDDFRHLRDEESERAEVERRRADEAERQVKAERERADEAERQAKAERERAARLAEKLRELGLDPHALD
jgi:Uma2 family endonuclease